jgi:hypothetical protein
MSMSDFSQFLDVYNITRWVTDRLAKNRFGFTIDRFLKTVEIIGRQSTNLDSLFG